METRQMRVMGTHLAGQSNLPEKMPLRSVRHLFRRDDFLW
jgi:hypothetical protein